MKNSELQCPFFRTDCAVCAASPRSRIPPAAVRIASCSGEGHEDCPTFLTRLLTSVVTHKRMRQSPSVPL